VSEAVAQPLAGDPAARVIVAGASGFAGALAAQLVWRHPRLELAAITARADAGKPLSALYARYRVPLVLRQLDDDALERIDAAIVAYPHGAAAPVVARMRGLGIQVVDLSADFRLRDLPTYERWYGPHGEPDLLESAVYGLTELYRDRIRETSLVANPGCYPTAAVLGLAPLAERGVIAAAVVDAKSGVSGAGRGGGEKHHFVNVDENFAPYGVDGHRHGPEIDQELHALGAKGGSAFVPHLLPLDQGLLASCYVELTEPLDADAVRSLYEDRYAGDPFVELADSPPGVRDVRDTNLCRIHATVDQGGERALVFAAIDNLWKGAAGQAVQNLNLMLGLDETEGLE
jgi:N-acetyl-gamma-glutamyl-phosphate reductase